MESQLSPSPSPSSPPSSWSTFVAQAPDLAAALAERFGANRHHVLATIRADGAPRLSGTEVDVNDTRLRVGMMPGSRKRADIERDPRVEVHSAPLDADLAAPDVKVAGTLVYDGEVTDIGGSWYVLDLTLVSTVRVDGEELVFEMWSPENGRNSVRRS